MATISKAQEKRNAQKGIALFTRVSRQHFRFITTTRKTYLPK